MERKALTARSVLASTLLGLDPPVLAVGVLVETAALFGISEGSARTALSRMAAAGEVVADGGRYRLTGRLLDRQRRQDEGRRPGLRRWNGRWRMAIVTGGRRSAADRAELRTALARLRLAEWREGVWLRPDNLDLAELAANPLADTSALAPGFVTSAAVLRHLAADPLLPPALLPDRWPGDELRSTYEQWDASYRRLLATWHRSRHG